ncbi:hypothetical protein MAPG_07209 [Magnaporthiopsis poae ATCC 64411]|uniref:Amine oxidase domain-containing protein n=1 Tax=Magnaporthiopsis poae (strain ATCC 64411 / 73-15) TaxID=644358 RepID=A0A0C4E421_MAGP6|nr:hypothetical protein MAPG_07209 [Magnaporthiopsis poae ATCC 64411]
MAYFHSKTAVTCALLALAATTTARRIDESRFTPEHIIVRDVAVIGGGASGSYAAVRVKDAGKSVVVIETKSHLGGHVDTYNDPRTGAAIDYGVLAYLDLPGVKQFFARFQIPTIAVTGSPFQNKYIDLKTGKPVPNYPAFSENATREALTTYATVAVQYSKYFFPSYLGLVELQNSGKPVPEDLTMPFGQFVAKYKIEAALPTIWTFASGLGDVLATPTVFVFQNFNGVHLQQISTGQMFRTANNSALFAGVTAYLGDESLMFGSRVAAADRGASGVKLLVKSRCGKDVLVKAKRLLVTIPPTKDNMYPLDADAAENAVFAKWAYSDLQVGIITGSGLPDGISITNVDPSGDNSTLHLPKGTFVDPIASTGVPGIFRTMVVGPAGMGIQAAKDLVRKSVSAMGAAGTFPNLNRIDFPNWTDHGASQLRVSGADLAAGFFSKLYALQGQKSTWFTGAAWTADYTSILWVFTEQAILPGLLAGL